MLGSTVAAVLPKHESPTPKVEKPGEAVKEVLSVAKGGHAGAKPNPMPRYPA